MKRKFFTVVSGIALSSFVLSSCDTPTGAGAGYGAAAGAIIGGAATGIVIAAAIGAAGGAGGGARLGHMIPYVPVCVYLAIQSCGRPLARYTNLQRLCLNRTFCPLTFARQRSATPLGPQTGKSVFRLRLIPNAFERAMVERRSAEPKTLLIRRAVIPGFSEANRRSPARAHPS